MMLMLMQQPNAVQTPSMLLPYILLKVIFVVPFESHKIKSATNDGLTLKLV